MNQIVINSSGGQNRIAMIENGELAQLFIESEQNVRTVGNIYVARVRKVMPGIKAAFIDMNTPKDAFLHFSDAGDNLEHYITMLNGNKAIPENVKLKEGEELKDASAKQDYVGKILQNGQKLLVQIVKEPISNKGPRISTDITIAGRYLVLIPMGNYIAVSKKINHYKERRRLKSIIDKVLPDGFGVIIRTVAKNHSNEELEQDLRDVLEKWEGISSRIHDVEPPTLLYRDLDMTESLIRDLFAKRYQKILIDDPKVHKQISQYVGRFAPDMAQNVELYKGKDHVFNHMKIAGDVNSIFSNRVRMPSAGYLIFEQTEAMYVVDVNSGPYASKSAQEDNSLKTNMEAAREIAKQLRLRDIGGIIVVDFIDLKEDANRKKVYDELKKEFSKDPAKTNLLPMSDFGLIQITRQRIRPSVINQLSVENPLDKSSGKVLSTATLISNLETWIATFKNKSSYKAVNIFLNPYLKAYLNQGVFSRQLKWSWKYKIRINFIDDEKLSLDEFRATLHNSDVDITTAVMEDINIDEMIEQSIQQSEVGVIEPEEKDIEVFEKPKHHSQKNNYDNNRNDQGAHSRSYNNDNRQKYDNRSGGYRNNRGQNDPKKSKYYKN